MTAVSRVLRQVAHIILGRQVRARGAMLLGLCTVGALSIVPASGESLTPQRIAGQPQTVAPSSPSSPSSADAAAAPSAPVVSVPAAAPAASAPSIVAPSAPVISAPGLVAPSTKASTPSLKLPPSKAPSAPSAALSDFDLKVAGAGKVGFLYSVTRPAGPNADHTLYLYGTIHVGDSHTFPINALVESALQSSRRMALEANPLDTATVSNLVRTLGTYSKPDALAQHIPPSLYERANALADKDKVPAGYLDTVKPWMAANVLDIMETVRLGFQPDQGADAILAHYAADHGLPIIEIEGMKMQIEMFEHLPAPIQTDMLRETLDEVDDGHASMELTELMTAWEESNVKAMQAKLVEMHQEKGAFKQIFVTQFLDARNKAMATRAEGLFAQDGSTFFAVGSLHLFGDAGLISELTRRGYTVKNLQQ